MYRVLIVDDEPWVLKGILNTFKWDDFGFQVIADTTDPVLAYEMILKQQPEVVMTDIRMPELTGIDLMKLSREQGVKAEFVIISGAADFHYAQESIRLGCFDYMLKPLQFAEADALLERLSLHLDATVLSINETAEESELQAGSSILSPSINENFKELLDYVNQHYEDELYLRELSNKFFINYTYCCDLFQKVTKSTFTDYVTRLRMNKAEQMLKESQLSIDEVSRIVGYKDCNYFNKVFKKWFGLTSTSYRKNQAAPWNKNK
ncbi:response regulator transcription factor [Paenibacillus agricola]|uniref:Response regulator n=1 Tax=Paenibacillus agricola TaxID=2716264 RepID=A0ABX0JGS7_9BACL|nr:helix-turn-helix domain-containing protein [Paenibacillus agricola]NHN32880.1 response regulator [Paenibacillus agricola]